MRAPGVRGRAFAFAFATVGTALAIAPAVAGDARTDTVDDIAFTFAVVGPPRAYAATSLGVATHRLAVTATNPSLQRLAIRPAFRYVAQRDGIDYECHRGVEGERPPAHVDAGAAVTFEQSMTCETPLPGTYEVAVRRDGNPDVVGHFRLAIGGGPNAPVNLPWEPRWWAATTGTRDAAPGPGPDSAVRVVVAIINASHDATPLRTHQARLRTALRGGEGPVCPEQLVPLGATGELAPGRVHWAWLTLECRLPAGKTYEITVTMAPNRRSELVVVGTVVVNVRSGPLIPPQ